MAKELSHTSSLAILLLIHLKGVRLYVGSCTFVLNGLQAPTLKINDMGKVLFLVRFAASKEKARRIPSRALIFLLSSSLLSSSIVAVPEKLSAQGKIRIRQYGPKVP